MARARPVDGGAGRSGRPTATSCLIEPPSGCAVSTFALNGPGAAAATTRSAGGLGLGVWLAVPAVPGGRHEMREMKGCDERCMHYGIPWQHWKRRSILHPWLRSRRFTVSWLPDCLISKTSWKVALLSQLLLLTVAGHATVAESIVTVFDTLCPLPTLAVMQIPASPSNARRDVRDCVHRDGRVA